MIPSSNIYELIAYTNGVTNTIQNLSKLNIKLSYITNTRIQSACPEETFDIKNLPKHFSDFEQIIFIKKLLEHNKEPVIVEPKIYSTQDYLFFYIAEKEGVVFQNHYGSTISYKKIRNLMTEADPKFIVDIDDIPVSTLITKYNNTYKELYTFYTENDSDNIKVRISNIYKQIHKTIIPSEITEENVYKSFMDCIKDLTLKELTPDLQNIIINSIIDEEGLIIDTEPDFEDIAEYIKENNS